MASRKKEAIGKTYGNKKSHSAYFKALVVIVIIGALAFAFSGTQLHEDRTEIKKFASADELNEYIESADDGGTYDFFGAEVQTLTEPQLARESAVQQSAGASAGASDYSATNIQVEGVDEADIVKNDGKYVYTVSGENVVIVNAFPPDGMEIASLINLSDRSPSQIYVNGDRLVVFGNYYNKTQITYINIYDISDRTDPVLEESVELNGSYSDSRMTGNYVYTIITTPVYRTGGGIDVPIFSPQQIGFPDIYYFDTPDISYQFTNILAINVKDGSVGNKAFLTGRSSSLFVSKDNIYLVYQKRFDAGTLFDRVLDEIILPAAPEDVADSISEIRNSDMEDQRKSREISRVLGEWMENMGPDEAERLQKAFEEKYESIQKEIAKEADKSIVHRISVDNGNIEYKTKGEVPGHPLNQFSMDEHDGYFRIATTTSFSGASLNHMYVLDMNMNIVGKLEDLAEGERIFSARFMGDRAYLVTFVRVDPLFVIDLSDPRNPKVLGELKIPGVSDYLHPYDENHIIGIGRSADDSEGRVRFKGIKLSLFDVSDVNDPKEVGKYEIGDRGTNSEALNDHKAFLFSKEKNLLVIPVLLADEPYRYSWQGAYVFSLTPEDGFALRGRVTHDNGTENRYFFSPNAVRRSLYMEDVLYTVSGKSLKANSLADMSEIKSVELPGPAPVAWIGPITIMEGPVLAVDVRA